MVKKVVELLLCDLDDGDVPAEQTVHFGLHGKSYVLDMCAGHLGGIEEVMAPYVEAAQAHRRSAGSGSRSRRRGARSARAATAGSSREIRAWAAGQGLTVNTRGRIPAPIVQQYQAAHGASSS